MAKMTMKQKRIKRFKALERKYKGTEAWKRQQALGNVLEKVTRSEKAYSGFLASFKASKQIIKIDKVKAERKEIAERKRKEKAAAEAKAQEQFLRERFKEKVQTELTEETFKAKEFLDDMISNRMDGVDKKLIDRVKEEIYQATDEELDGLADMFGNGWEGWKEFYEHNYEYQAGANTVSEKEGILNEIIDYLS